MMELNREKWSQEDYGEFVEYLKSLADEKYKKFSDGLVPGDNKSLGVRVPQLRNTAKEIAKGNYKEFLSCSMGEYREEIMIYGLVMTNIKCEYKELMPYAKDYSEKIKSWETCDIVSFKRLKKYTDEMLGDIEYFIYSNNPWQVRYGFGMLMEFCLEDKYIDKVFEYVNSINSDFYYVQMMQGWLVATAMAKCRDKTVEFLKNNKLNDTTQNMAVRKIRESNRISKEDKELVKKFKRHIG